MSLQSRTKYRQQCLGWEGLPTYPPITTRENLSVFDTTKKTHKNMTNETTQNTTKNPQLQLPNNTLEDPTGDGRLKRSGIKFSFPGRCLMSRVYCCNSRLHRSNF